MPTHQRPHAGLVPPSFAATRAISRRSFLRSAAIAGTVLGASSAGAWVRSDGSVLPLVAADPSDSILDSWGVNLHQSHVITDADGGVYARQNYDATLDLMADLGVRVYRDVLKTEATGNGQRKFYADAYALHGMKGSLVMGRRGGAPTYDAQSTTYRNDLAAYATANPEIFVQMEGYNEPNLVTGGRPSDWDAQVVDHAKWIWNLSARIASNEGVLIPTASASLHNVTSTRLQDYIDLAKRGWANYCHRANIHCYPGDNRPSGLAGSNSDISQRTAHAYTYGGFNPATQPATNTESGYFTTTAARAADAGDSEGGGAWVPYDVHENYVVKHLLEWLHLDRAAATPLGCLHQFYYELFDDPDSSNSDRESNLGLIEVPNKTNPSTWTVKPAFTAIQTFLATMADPGPVFHPAPLPLTVTGATEPSVKWRLYGRRDGTYQLVLWRDNANIWSEGGGYVDIPTINMTVTTPAGAVSVPVGRDVVVQDLAGSHGA